MRQLKALIKKEYLELLRTGKFTLLAILFAIMGIMAPAFAKMTPWLFSMLGSQMEAQGIVIKEVTVTAITSWDQYYKNIGIALIIIVVMLSATLTNEYQKGTLIQILTKGMTRTKVIMAKAFTVISVWTICYWLCFLITYGYTVYFWDNSIAQHVWFAGSAIYVLGLWLVTLIILGSTLLNTGISVMLFVGGAFVLSYLLSIIPTISEYLPTHLLDAGGLLSGGLSQNTFIWPFCLVLVLSVVNLVVSKFTFDKKRL